MDIPLLLNQHEVGALFGHSPNTVYQKLITHRVPYDLCDGVYLIDWEEYMWRVPMVYRTVPADAVQDWLCDKIGRAESIENLSMGRDGVKRRLYAWTKGLDNDPRRCTLEDIIWEWDWLRIGDIISEDYVDLQDFHTVSKTTIEEIINGEYTATTSNARPA